MLGGSEAQPVSVGGRLRFAQGPQPHSAEQVLRWEALASAVSEQDLDEQGALACLVVTRGRYLIRHTTVLLGRSTGVCLCVHARVVIIVMRVMNVTQALLSGQQPQQPQQHDSACVCVEKVL